MNKKELNYIEIINNLLKSSEKVVEIEKIIRILFNIDRTLVLNTIAKIRSEQYHTASITSNES